MVSIEKIIHYIKLFYRGFGKYRRQIGILITLGFFGSLLEGIGINALIPLFSFVTGQGNSNDIISQTIKKVFLYFNIGFNIKFLLIFISLLFVIKAILVLISNYITVRINSGYEEETKSNLFKITLKAGWPYLLKQKLGHLETVLVTNVKNSSILLGYISSIVILAISLVVYAFIAINISFYITLITLAFSSFLFFVFKPIIRRTRLIAYEEEKINREISHHVNENILGMKTIKAMLMEGRIAEIAKDYFKRLKNIRIKTYLLVSLGDAFMEPASLIFICIIFAISYYKNPNFNLAALGAVIYLIKQIFSYAQQLQKYILGVSAATPYLKNVLEYEKQALDNKEENYGSAPFKFNDILEFKNVNFLYDKKKLILSDINFYIKKGEMVGLIGPSGAGKTTIVDLILRLFNLNQGEILIDKININKIDIQEWRKNIGYVSQDIFLMNDTIANNIKFYDESISENEVEEAAKMANIYDFIQGCPDKFSTMIGERGVLLSAGQRQRIIIARILARRPQFLILDEATSALDNESERQIQEVIENLKNRITVFVIAHRLTTLTNSDRLLALEKGKIVEQGKPSELLSDKESYFYKVYNIKK